MLLVLLALAPALAADPASPTPVLVSAFQPQNPEAGGLAALIEAAVAQRLVARPELRVLAVEDAPAFQDYAARTYMDACPPGDAVGCTLVVGERAGARYAVTGSVQALPGSARVTVSLIDVAGARVMITFRSDLPVGQDTAFADAVADLVIAAMRGEVGGEVDIREDAPEKRRPSEEEVAELLASGDLGVVSEVATRARITRPVLTMADLAGQGGGEVEEPWTRLGMKPEEYLRYRNSGLPLQEWRARALGRQSQLVLRSYLGWWRGPSDTLYRNRYAYDATLVVEDSWSATVPRTGNGVTGALEVGFGLLPWLDVAVAGGLAPGDYTVDVAWDQGTSTPVELHQRSAWFGPRVNVALFPTSALRPTFGAGATLLRTHAVSDFAAVPAQAYVFPAEWLVSGHLHAGGEARLNDHLDAFVRVPLDVRVAGGAVREQRQTTNSALVPVAPAADSRVAVGVLVGLQVRLFGRDVPETSRFEELEEPRD